MRSFIVIVAVFTILHIPLHCRAQYYDHYADHEDPHGNEEQCVPLYDGWSIQEIKNLCTDQSNVPCPLTKLNQSTDRGKHVYKIQSETLAIVKERIERYEQSFATVDFKLWVRVGFMSPVLLGFFWLWLSKHWSLKTAFIPHPFDGSFGFDPVLYQSLKFKIQRISDKEVTRMFREERAVADVQESGSSTDEEKFAKYTPAQQSFLRRKRLYKKAAARTRFINLERKRYQAESDLIKKENARTGFLNRSDDYKERVATKFARKGVDETALFRSKLHEKYGELEEEEYEIASKFK